MLIQLNNTQTGQVEKWVNSQQLTLSTLKHEFVDHICCDIEILMSEGTSFKLAFEKVKSELGNDYLPEIEKETINKINYNQMIMKKAIRYTGISVLVICLISIIMNLAGDGSWKYVMAGGMAILSFGFVPLFFYNSYNQQEKKRNRVLHILGFLSAFLLPGSALLSVYNSPAAFPVFNAGIIFLVFGFVPLSIVLTPRGTERYALTGGVIILLFYVLITFGLMGVRIAKNKVDNWYFLSVTTEESLKLINSINDAAYSKTLNDSVIEPEVVKIRKYSEALENKILSLRNGFISRKEKNNSGTLFPYKDMDNPYVAKKLLIENEKTTQMVQEMLEYEDFLIIYISEENELVKDRIRQTLHLDESRNPENIENYKNYLFYKFPVITDIAILNTLALNIRLAENQVLYFKSGYNFNK